MIFVLVPEFVFEVLDSIPDWLFDSFPDLILDSIRDSDLLSEFAFADVIHLEA